MKEIIKSIKNKMTQNFGILEEDKIFIWAAIISVLTILKDSEYIFSDNIFPQLFQRLSLILFALAMIYFIYVYPIIKSYRILKSFYPYLT